MKDNLKIIAMVVTFVIGFFGISYHLTKYKCEDYQNNTGKNTFYSWPKCYVQINDEWLTMKQYNLTLRATRIETK